jgi:SAM-dependent methyltransferase
MKKELWASGYLYEPYVGRWSRVVASEFVAWLDVPDDKRWLDVGCGTGALTQCVLRDSAPERVHGVDRSSGFVEYARAHTPSALASFEVGDAQALPVASGDFDVAIAGLVLNFVPKPDRVVAEMRRAVHPGGTVAAYVWDYAGKMELMRYFWDAAIEVDPDARAHDEGVRFPLCQPKPLAALFRVAGLANVEVRAFDVPTRFHDFDDYWTPFLGGQAPAPTYCVSLDEDRRARLRERIRAKLPFGTDGSIDLIARAWAVKGRVPTSARSPGS